MSTIAETADDADDSSSSSPVPLEHNQTLDSLDEFRKKWQQELHEDNTIAINDDQELDQNLQTAEHIVKAEQDEEKAKRLFMQGAELEKLGKVFEAMRLYRNAIQIVPDIEFKIYESTKGNNVTATAETDRNKNDDALNANDITEATTETNLEDIDLMARFQLAIQRSGRLFQTMTGSEKTVLRTELHISDLPMEIILYILKWVVSADLDLRSLDQCSLVSKGFYICARDQDIWRLACLKIWGVHVGTLKTTSYTLWRNMFLERHRVHFNGCYISKTSYLRYGENSFQDQFYRPIHLIEYFRYIRFFSDGRILMMTTADDPSITVGKLNVRNPLRNDVLKGHYRLHGEVIIIVLKRNKLINSKQQQQRRGSLAIDKTEQSHTLYLEFTIASSAKRKFNQIFWKKYSIIQVKNKNEITTDFELTPTMYPPLTFSRVKSYNLVSESPLI